jgi:hypothetical protein
MKLESKGRNEKGNRRKALKNKKHVKESNSGRGEKVMRKGNRRRASKMREGEKKGKGIER